MVGASDMVNDCVRCLTSARDCHCFPFKTMPDSVKAVSHRVLEATYTLFLNIFPNAPLLVH